LKTLTTIREKLDGLSPWEIAAEAALRVRLLSDPQLPDEADDFDPETP